MWKATKFTKAKQGLATDYTVKNSAIDAIALGYKVKLLTDAVQGITPEGSSAALTELRRLCERVCIFACV